MASKTAARASVGQQQHCTFVSSVSNCCPTATLLEFLPQLEELDVSWNELIGGCLKALTSHLHHVVGLRALRLCGCRLSADDITALGGSISVENCVSRGRAQLKTERLCTGEVLSCTSALEILDLSWNGGVGGAALQGMLGNLDPSLQELHLVSCQLTAADAAVLGTVCSCE